MAKDGEQLATLETLPDNVDTCHSVINQLGEQLRDANLKISKMEHQLAELLRKLYGRSSEKLDPRQMALFAELFKELQAAENNGIVVDEPVAAEKPRNNGGGHGRRRIPDDLPRERVIHDLDDDEKPCPCCGKQRELIGQETSEQLDYEPAKIKVIEHVRLKYICKSCEQSAAQGGPQIEVAAKPPAAIEKCLAAPGLLSYVIVGKYGDHLPLHRIETILSRHDIDISRSTMCDWMAQSADALLPLYDLMIDQVRQSDVIHTDDTPVDVQDRKLSKTRQGRFWVYVGDVRHPYIVFDYTSSRSRDGPMGFLKNWGADRKRYLQADAFGGYDGIYAGHAGGNVVEVACWAHTRRKFFEARHTDHMGSAHALGMIRLLYEVEDKAIRMFDDQKDKVDAKTLARIRLELRVASSQSILQKFKSWMESQQTANGGRTLPKSPMGQAITYAMNQWQALCEYCTSGELNIDNNAAENALRRIALGRKNWMFCGSDNGGRTAATLFSLIASCQRHEVNPFVYLKDVLTRIAGHQHNKLAELLPDKWKEQAKLNRSA